jgi:hypothetical protein
VIAEIVAGSEEPKDGDGPLGGVAIHFESGVVMSLSLRKQHENIELLFRYYLRGGGVLISDISLVMGDSDEKLRDFVRRGAREMRQRMLADGGRGEIYSEPSLTAAGWLAGDPRGHDDSALFPS